MKILFLLSVVAGLLNNVANASEIICNLDQLKNVSIFIESSTDGAAPTISMLDNLDQSRPYEQFSTVTAYPDSVYFGYTTTSAYFKKGKLIEIQIDEETAVAKVMVGRGLFKRHLTATCKSKV